MMLDELPLWWGSEELPLIKPGSLAGGDRATSPRSPLRPWSRWSHLDQLLSVLLNHQPVRAEQVTLNYEAVELPDVLHWNLPAQHEVVLDGRALDIVSPTGHPHFAPVRAVREQPDTTV